MRRLFGFLAALFLAAVARAQVDEITDVIYEINNPPSAFQLVGTPVAGDMLYFDGTNWVRLSIGTNGQVVTVSSGLPTWAAAAGGGASTAASYITSVAEAGLSNEFALGTLASGLLLNTTTTGIPTIYGGGSCTNQFIRSLNASGAPTCATVAAATDVSGLAAVATSGSATDLSAGTVPCAREPALTGNVTSSAGSCATTIAAGVVTLADMANLAANSIMCNNTGSPATPIACTTAQLKTLIAIASGDVSGLAAIATSGSASDLSAGTVPVGRMPASTGDVVCASGTFACTIQPAAVTYAKIQNVANARFLCNNSGGAAAVSECLIDATLTWIDATHLGRSATTGDVVCASGSNACTIQAAVVSYSKIQNVSATNRLLGRSTAGAGSIEEITPATCLSVGSGNLTMAATTTNPCGTVVAQASTPGTEQTSTNFNIAGLGIFSKDAIGTTPGDAAEVSNVTASTSGVPVQYSPAVTLCGTAYNSTSTLSEVDCWRIYNKPVTVAGATTETLTFDSSINGGAYSVGRFTFTSAGGFGTIGSITSGANVIAAAGNNISWTGRTAMKSSADALINFINTGGTSFTRLTLGLETTAFPSLKVNGAGIDCRLGDDTGYCSSPITTGEAGYVVKTANGASVTYGSISEQLTLATGAAFTDTVGNLLPANSLIEAIGFRVTTSITTATTIQFGDATTTGRFSGALSATPCGAASIASGANAVCLTVADPTATAAAGPQQVAAAKLRVSTNVNPGAGVVRITVWFKTFAAPTS